MKTPPIRLAFGALFWRAFLVVFLALEVGLWRHLRPFLARRDPGFRVAAMILHTPKMLVRAFLVAAVFTVLIDLYVRFVMRPLMARRLSPRGDADAHTTPLAFRLARDERVLAEMPGRIVMGRRLQPGTLAATDRRVWFTPHAWDVEPWSLALDHVEAILRVPAPTRFGSLILGLPDRVRFLAADGTATDVAVADPDAVLDLFPDKVAYDEPGYEPSPMQLV